jgi:CheY-like chemotaxis protein
MFMATRYSILCIDDNRDTLDVFQSALLRAGHQVHIAIGGANGVAVLDQLSTVDIVVVNSVMRDVSGMDVVAYMAALPRFDSTGIVLQSSGCVLDLPIHHPRWPRVDVCLPAPFQTSELYDAIFEAYTRRRGYLYHLAI